MKVPTLRLTSVLILCGWFLVLGGIYETVDILHRAWSFPSWDLHTLLLRLVRGPAVHIGLGAALWALSRR